VLVSLVAPGNTYPACESPKNEKESLVGKPIFSGYQSHFSIGNIPTPQKSNHFSVRKGGDPVRVKKKKSGDAMEIVIDQETQVLPRYIIYFQRNNTNKPKKSTKEIQDEVDDDWSEEEEELTRIKSWDQEQGVMKGI